MQNPSTVVQAIPPANTVAPEMPPANTVALPRPANPSEIWIRTREFYKLNYKKYPLSTDASAIINNPNNIERIYQYEEEQFTVDISLNEKGLTVLNNDIEELTALIPYIYKVTGSIPSFTPYDKSKLLTYKKYCDLSYLLIGDNSDKVNENILKKLKQPVNEASSTGLDAPSQTFIKFAIERFNAYLDYAIVNGTTTRILMINTVKLIEALFSYNQYYKERDFYKFMNEDPDLWLNAKCVGIRNDEILNVTSQVSPQPVFKSEHMDNKFWQFVFGLGIGGLWNDVKLKTKATEPDGVDIYEWKMWGGKRKTNKKKSKKSKKVKKNKRKSKKSKTKKK